MVQLYGMTHFYPPLVSLDSEHTYKHIDLCARKNSKTFETTSNTMNTHTHMNFANANK